MFKKIFIVTLLCLVTQTANAQTWFDTPQQAMNYYIGTINNRTLVLQRNLFRATLIYIPCYDSKN
jgi:hypothetical protein